MELIPPTGRSVWSAEGMGRGCWFIQRPGSGYWLALSPLTTMVTDTRPELFRKLCHQNQSCDRPARCKPDAPLSLREVPAAHREHYFNGQLVPCPIDACECGFERNVFPSWLARAAHARGLNAVRIRQSDPWRGDRNLRDEVAITTKDCLAQPRPVLTCPPVPFFVGKSPASARRCTRCDDQQRELNCLTTSDSFMGGGPQALNSQRIYGTMHPTIQVPGQPFTSEAEWAARAANIHWSPPSP